MFEIVLVNVYFEVLLIYIIFINKIFNIYCNDKNLIDK